MNPLPRRDKQRSLKSIRPARLACRLSTMAKTASADVRIAVAFHARLVSERASAAPPNTGKRRYVAKYAAWPNVDGGRTIMKRPSPAWYPDAGIQGSIPKYCKNAVDRGGQGGQHRDTQERSQVRGAGGDVRGGRDG